MSIRMLDQPVPDPTYELDPDGDSPRTTIINCALVDCREREPAANYMRVGQYVDHYLTLWERRAIP